MFTKLRKCGIKFTLAILVEGHLVIIPVKLF